MNFFISVDINNSNDNNNNNNNNKNDIIFFKLWRDKEINRLIFKYAALYKKNRAVTFVSLNSLRNYKEREYITNLNIVEQSDYGKSTLIKGDLPENGVLKSIDLEYIQKPIQSSDVFPQGIEIIKFSEKNTIQILELPPSVHTIANVQLKKPYIDNPIPNNITSLSFKQIDYLEFYDIKLPLSIVKLDLSCLTKHRLPLASKLSNFQRFVSLFSQNSSPSSTFIPTSVTDLKTLHLENKLFDLPKIPSSVTKLHLIVGGTTPDFNLNNGLIHFGVRGLTIQASFCSIIISENSLPKSITKLTIISQFDGKDNQILPNSIPDSVLDLNIQFMHCLESYKDIFPPNLTSLSLSTSKTYSQISIPEISELPPTIKYLKFNGVVIDINKK